MQEKKTGGSFVTIASTAGIRPRPGLVWYNASKAAVINASKAMAVEYAKDNIRFNTVSRPMARYYVHVWMTLMFACRPVPW